jgi:hypothetical protein
MFEQITKFANEATDTITTTVSDAINDNDIADRFTTTSDQILDAVLDVNRRIVDVAVTTADRIVEQINVDLPLGDRFPTPTVAGERYLDFVERAVSLNRDMNQRVAEMIKADTTRAASGKVGTAKVATAKKAPVRKAAARKAPAKKAPARKAAARKAPARKTVAQKTVTA